MSCTNSSAESAMALKKTKPIERLLLRDDLIDAVQARGIQNTPTIVESTRTLRVGILGSGKSTTCELEAMDFWLDRFARRGLLVVDPHGSMAKSLCRRLWFSGRGDRLVFDAASCTSHVLGYASPVIVGEGFEWELNLFNAAIQAAEVLNDERGNLDRLNVHPYLRTHVIWAKRLELSLGLTPAECEGIYAIGSERLNALVARCPDVRVREAYAEVCTWPRSEIERQLGVARRLYESAYGNPLIRERRGSFDHMSFLESGGALIVDLSGMAQEAMRPFYLWLVISSIQEAMKRRFPLLVIGDEANRGLSQSALLLDLAEQCRKAKISISLCKQGIAFSPELRGRWFQAFNRIELYQCSPDVLKDMLHFLWPLVDFHRVHHTELTWREYSDGFEEVPRHRISRTKTESKHGGDPPSTSKSESWADSWDSMLVAKRKLVAEQRDHYWQTNDQLIDNAVDVMQQAPGECLVLQNGRARWWSVPEPPPEFPRGFENYYEREFEEFLSEMRSRPYFRVPQARSLPVQIGAACRWKKIKAEASGSIDGSNTDHRQLSAQ